MLGGFDFIKVAGLTALHLEKGAITEVGTEHAGLPCCIVFVAGFPRHHLGFSTHCVENLFVGKQVGIYEVELPYVEKVLSRVPTTIVL